MSDKQSQNPALYWALAAVILVVAFWYVLAPLLGLAIAFSLAGVGVLVTVVVGIVLFVILIHLLPVIFVLMWCVLALIGVVVAVLLFPFLFPLVVPLLILCWLIGFLRRRSE